MNEIFGGKALGRPATVAALAVIAVGSLICATWLVGAADATRLMPASSAVRFSTGLCFMLNATGLLLVIGRHHRWAPAALAPVLVIAGFTLLEYLVGRGSAIIDAIPYSDRMAPNTAVALLVAATGLTALTSGRSRIWALSMSAVLGALTVALGLVAILGYAFDLTAAFEWAGLTRMALLTAITLVALGVAIILATRDVGRIASWIEQPWLASSVGVGAAGLGLLASHALAEAFSLPAHVLAGLDAAGIAFALLIAGVVAQARHMRLLTLQLAAGNLRLAEQSAEIADLYENAPCGYYSLDADGRIVRINRTALAWLGFDRHEVLGRKTLYDLLAAGSRQVLDAHSPRFTRGGAAPDLQLDLLRKDGSILPVVLSETAVYDAWGAFHHSRSTLFDDSERRRFEQALRDSEQRLHLLVDTVQTAVVVHAADSSIEFANPTAAELLGLTREQLLGRMAIDPGWSFVREDGSPMPVEEYPVSRVLQRGLALRDYVTGIHVPGSDAIRWVLVNAVPSIDENGKLRQVIVSFIDISERQRQKLRLEQLAATDALTGLATRRHLLDMSKHELARARRSGQPLAVIMVDIDRFKSINDRFGHETGDVVLRRVGELLRAELRGSDVAARWGGEEFCLLLPDSNPDAAMETAERLRAAIEAAPMAAGDQSVLKVTASFGVAVSGPDDERLSRLVNAADQAMYQSKREGRNRVRLAAATPSPGAASPTPAGSTPAADR